MHIISCSTKSSHPDSSDTDQLDPQRSSSPQTMQKQHFNWTTSLTRSRKSMGGSSGSSGACISNLSGRNASAPNSPSQKFEFFGEFGEYFLRKFLNKYNRCVLLGF